MFENTKDSRGESFGKEALDLILELEKNTAEHVKEKRAHARLVVRCKVVARPGNLSQRDSLKVEGVTGDVSDGGCQILFPRPLMVGDIYQLSFDRKVLDIQPLLAICRRCRTVRDDAFEAGFAFFRSVPINEALGKGKPQDDSLI